MKLLMISTDRKIFEQDSAVALRQLEYAKKYEEVHIIIFSNKDYKEASLGSNIWIYPTSSLSRWLYIYDALKISSSIVLKQGITNVTCQDPFETGMVGALLKKKFNINLELQIHTDIGSPYFQNHNLLNRIRSLLAKYTLKRADHVRVVSERIKKYIKKYVDEQKIEIRPIAVDTGKIKNAEIKIDLRDKYPQFSKIILVASRLEKEKNIEMAFQALKIVLRAMPDIGMVVVGKGSQEKHLKELVCNLNIERSVIFEGWQDDMASYYKSCDTFLVTAWYEGYGMTLVEAQASGCKIVSPDVGVAKEIGAEIAEFNPEDIAQKLLKCLQV